MDAFIKESPINYKVSFWDGEPHDAASGKGHAHVAPIGEKDERKRGMLYWRSQEPKELFGGDAIVEHWVDGQLAGIAVMDRDAAMQTFHFASASPRELAPDTTDESDKLAPPSKKRKN